MGGGGYEGKKQVCVPKVGLSFVALYSKFHFFSGGNHLEERLLDQAQARMPYPPLFGGHSRSTPQGMIFDVRPLVTSLFCPTTQSPNSDVIR